MFSKVLVANRGEIAVRILRALREMGVASVVVHSDADDDQPAVRLADEAVCIGPAPARQSYLKIPAVLAACVVSGADAIHPGYGFLSENPEFAEICARAGITFIGPSAAVIRQLGDKLRARAAVAGLGLPVLPASDAVVDEATAHEAADRIGYPVIVKAAGGGGGRGMRVVRTREALSAAVHSARTEARAAFGNGTVYLERLLERPRHIELQFAADAHGGAVHLGERECSLQRRHQKIMEESPSPVMDAATRADIGGRVAAAMARLGYVGVGTCELLRDAEGALHFLEVNPRLQVEHPVTEVVTGIDLVQLQLRLAAGEPLGFEQSDVQMRGHALECRITAEDPETLRPGPGRVSVWCPPGGPGVRVDAGIEVGSEVSPFYDSLLAKVIVHAPTREQALARMRRALGELRLEGPACNVKLHQRLLDNAAVRAGDLDTGLLERILGEPRA